VVSGVDKKLRDGLPANPVCRVRIAASLVSELATIERRESLMSTESQRLSKPASAKALVRFRARLPCRLRILVASGSPGPRSPLFVSASMRKGACMSRDLRRRHRTCAHSLT
jgi:hypothetical protein